MLVHSRLSALMRSKALLLLLLDPLLVSSSSSRTTSLYLSNICTPPVSIHMRAVRYLLSCSDGMELPHGDPIPLAPNISAAEQHRQGSNQGRPTAAPQSNPLPGRGVMKSSKSVNLFQALTDPSESGSGQ